MLDVGIVVHHLAHRVDELDDQLGHEVSRSGFAAEDKRARRDLQVGIIFQALIERDDVQDVQVLPLVFVNTLHLAVE